MLGYLLFFTKFTSFHQFYPGMCTKNFKIIAVVFSCLLIFINKSHAQQTNCDDTKRPVVFCHGFLGSGDTYANQVMRFTANGYCIDRMFAFDWNSLSVLADNPALLDVFINEILAETGAIQVDLAGHSAGGGLGYNYLSDPARAAKVAHYVHIGSSVNDAPAGPAGEIPTLNIWSVDDEVVAGGAIPGATNVMQTGADHYEVATNAETFEAMYQFFNDDSSPITTGIIPEAEVKVSGRALTFGENSPENGATIQIYETNPETGYRINEDPDYLLITDENGYWGPFDAVPFATYEFLVLGTAPDARPLHYYREGFFRSNSLVYLRTIPPPTSLAGLLLAGLPQDDMQTLMVMFSANQAVISGRDELYAAGIELSTEMWASSDQTTIAFFLYDDGDYVTSEGGLGLFGTFPFLNGVDIFFPTDPPGSINLQLNGHELNIPNWRSGTDGPVVVVFDLVEPEEPPVSIGPPLIDNSISVFPNPFTSELHISIPTKEYATIELYSIKGELLQKAALPSNASILDTADLPNGTYFAKIIQGETVFVEKVVK